MILSSVQDLRACDERAVIINFNTKLVTTLALMSAIRHAGTPVLLIDCESTDGSFEHFAGLMDKYPFDLLSAPLRQHGETLDWLFREVPDRKLLLIDSDLEIRDPWILAFFRDYIDDDQTFGCGFFNGPGWITDHPGTSIEHAYYQERCWMPLALLKVTPAREAIRAGHSFASAELYNDFAPSYSISRWMKSVRDRYPALRKREAPRALKLFRTSFYGHRPSLVVYDTGAAIFQYLKYRREMLFVGLPEKFAARYVTHFGGVTRTEMDPDSLGHHITDSQDKIRDEVQARLAAYLGEPGQDGRPVERIGDGVICKDVRASTHDGPASDGL